MIDKLGYINRRSKAGSGCGNLKHGDAAPIRGLNFTAFLPFLLFAIIRRKDFQINKTAQARAKESFHGLFRANNSYPQTCTRSR